MKLAQRLCQFPQDCMRADRASAYYSTYDAISYDDAFQKEWQQGSPVVQKESVKGQSWFHVLYHEVFLRNSGNI